MRLHELLEVRIITNPKNKSVKHEPLKDNQTIRVYHGMTSYSQFLSAIQHGISGKQTVTRNYGYESNNNPTGVFVSPDLRVAKEFGRYILEFHARVTDLEAPIWPNGGFPSAGVYAPSFKDDSERDTARVKARDAAIARGDRGEPHIKDSDRPELASLMMSGGESQALYTGNMNPNGIRAVWVLEGNHYKRYTVSEFLSRHQNKHNLMHLGDNKPDSRNKYKLFKPREHVDVGSMFRRHASVHDITIDTEEEYTEAILNGWINITGLLWPDQIKEVLSDLVNRGYDVSKLERSLANERI